MESLKIRFLSDRAKVPTKGSAEAAGYDLYAANDSVITIKPHETVAVPTDLAIELPQGTFGGIFARSGLATKSGLRPANCVGVIDSDYRGNVTVALHNDSNDARTIGIGERIAQLVVIPYVTFDNIITVSDLSDTERGTDGFGSSGKF